MYTSVSNTETSILNLTPYIIIKTNGSHIRYRPNKFIFKIIILLINKSLNKSIIYRTDKSFNVI